MYKKKRYMPTYGPVSLFFILFSVLTIITCFNHLLLAETQPSESSDTQRLIELACERKLHQHAYWNILLHYEDALIGVKSQVDDPNFFLAPDGKTNPKAELKATIRALFQQDDQAAKPYICRFYARFKWLKEILDIDPAAYKNFVCEEIDRIEPQSASLIFPTYCMNNPASMFGHTLLAINTDYTSKRLAYAVNYAARADNVNGLSFAISGIFGLYKGYYSIEPYYKKIQEYSDIHQRDIWEYKLNLTPEELKRLIWHVKEFRGIYTDYFFFDENCSYNLLYLLEAARPSLNLVSRFKVPAVLPADTIRVMKDEGLITSVAFRPSKASKIKHKIAALDDKSIRISLDIIEGKIKLAELLSGTLAREKQIMILDLVSEQLQYLYVKKTIDKAAYRKSFLAALKARSKLGRDDSPYEENLTTPPDPVDGHASKRISLGGGVHKGDTFVELRFRPAFTDLVDMDYILHKGAQIEFADARIRYYTSDLSFKLHQLDLIDIVSVSARDAFFKPLSWKFNTGFHRKPMQSGDEQLFYRLNTGTGVATEYPFLGLSYAMIEGEMDISGALEEGFALGGGATCGVIKTFAWFWKEHFFLNFKWFFAGDDHKEHSAGVLNNFKLSKNNQVSLELKWTKVREWDKTDIQALWHFFF